MSQESTSTYESETLQPLYVDRQRVFGNLILELVLKLVTINILYNNNYSCAYLYFNPVSYKLALVVPRLAH